MQRTAFSPLALCAALSFALTGTAWSQQVFRSTAPRAATAPAGSAATAPAAVAPGAPSPTGLASPTPFPAGLPSPTPFPAGVPSTVIPGAGLEASGGLAGNGGVALDPSGAAVQEQASAGVPSTGVLGGPGIRAQPQFVPSGPGPYTALQVAQSFITADANRDGDLTRAEAQRLTILPFAFEEMDRNRDGVLSRSEYEDALR